MNSIDGMTRVAHVSEIKAGTMRCFVIGSKRLLIAYNNGQYYAVDEMCTHEEVSLCGGSLKDHYIKCPLHGSRFNLINGEAVDEPADEALRTYPLAIHNDEIYVNLKTH